MTTPITTPTAIPLATDANVLLSENPEDGLLNPKFWHLVVDASVAFLLQPDEERIQTGDVGVDGLGLLLGLLPPGDDEVIKDILGEFTDCFRFEIFFGNDPGCAIEFDGRRRDILDIRLLSDKLLKEVFQKHKNLASF